MHKNRISQLLDIRHFEESDIPLRREVMNDSVYITNVRDTALRTDDKQIYESYMETLRESPRSMVMFTACTRKGKVLGFTWVYDIDWDRPSGQMSIAMLPKYRSGWGYAAIQATAALLYDEYNFQSLTTQIFTHNTMMHSDEWIAQRSDIVMPYFSFTGGEFRHSRVWTQSRDEYYFDQFS